MSDWKNNIKQKMERREIKPSDAAWNDLDLMLNQDNTKQKSNLKWWLGIAASLLLIVSIGFWFLEKDSIKTQTTIANKKTNNFLIEENHIIDSTEKSFETPSVKPNIVTSAKVDVKDKPTKNISPYPSKKVEPAKEHLVIHGKEDSTNIPSQTIVTIEPEINQQPTADDYLAKAMQRRFYNQKSTITVNEHQLLNEVEDHLFEQQKPVMLGKITNQIKELKIAFAERNIEK